MVRIGLVGIGFMGRVHFLASAGVAGAKVAAICSRDPVKRAGDWTNTRGNFGPAPGHVDLAGVRAYADYAEMLADPGIDLVDICTVTDQHAPLAVAALRAGKHVLVEKAIALTPADADSMLAAARESGKTLMVAHVLPFFPEFAFAYDAVKSGSYGKLVAAHFTRVIAKPDWSADMGDAGKTGGPAVDLHVHDTHFIGLLCGVPDRVFSTGRVEPDGSVSFLTTQYLYPPGGPAVTCASGAVAMPGRPFVHGFEIYLEKATLAYSSAGTALTLFDAVGNAMTPELAGGGDPLAAFAAEIATAVGHVRDGTEPVLLSGQLARDALVLCYRECESVKTGVAVAVR